MKRSKKIIAVIVLAVIFGGGAAMFYAHHPALSSENGEGSSPQAMPVEVYVVEPQVIQIWKKFSGHVVAVDQVEIRPQVSGRITEILFEDGQHVEKGDTLIVIDPRSYEAALNQAQAELAAAKTQADLAEKQYRRAKELVKTDAVSHSLMDERSNNKKVAAAAIQGAKARVESAKINLDYAYVKAPISGKVSRAEITEGNLVQAGPGAPLLTSIVADENLYVDFEVDDQTYMSSVQNISPDAKDKIPVRLNVPNVDLEYEGCVHSFDNRINSASGTIRARAI